MTKIEPQNNSNPILYLIIGALAFWIYTQSQQKAPSPTPTPTPDVEVRSDKALVDGSAKAAKALLQAMADDLDELAAQAVQGKIHTVSDAGKANTEMDEVTRRKFKQSMSDLWKGKLGDKDLPISAPQIFIDTANGFRKAAK